MKTLIVLIGLALCSGCASIGPALQGFGQGLQQPTGGESKTCTYQRVGNTNQYQETCY